MNEKAKRSHAVADCDQPWIENYLPLKDWLTKIGAWCDHQISQGVGMHRRSIEQWRAPNAVLFIIVILPRHMGWNVYTAAPSDSIEETFEDANKRLWPEQYADGVKADS